MTPLRRLGTVDSTDLQHLRALILLLREHNVLEYSSGDVSLKLGIARPEAQAHPASPTAVPHPLEAKFKQLPAYYQELFSLQGKQ